MTHNHILGDKYLKPNTYIIGLNAFSEKYQCQNLEETNMQEAAESAFGQKAYSLQIYRIIN